MGERLLSDKEVAERLGVSRVSVWRWTKAYADFPKPIQLVPGTTRWRSAHVEAWIENRQEVA